MKRARALIVTTAISASVLLGGALGGRLAQASDHDDGSQSTANKNMNLTDLLVYREKDQNTGVVSNNLIFQMNLNARSIAGADYAFSPHARYEFHITRAGKAADVATRPTGKEDVLLRFEFGQPDANGAQAITTSLIHDGKTETTPAGTTTVLAKASTPVTTDVTLNTKSMKVFAGLREDTFFFDVDQFFKVRATAAARAGGSTVAQAVFRNPGVDFTAGFNVLSIIASVPREMLQTTAAESVFDVWETISAQP